MINPVFFIGQPIDFKGICKVYPPKVKDILAEKNFQVYKKLFLSSQEDIEDDYADKDIPIQDLPTPLEQLFLFIEENPRLKDFIASGLEFFIKEPVTLLPDKKVIVVGEMSKILPNIKNVSELRIINEDNFFDLQNLIRESLGEKAIDPYNPNENPRVKEFKRKSRMRERVKAKNSKNGLDLGTVLATICCMNLGITPLNIGELSYVSIPILTRYYQEKTKYDIDISSLLAGGDKKKIKPQNWIRIIEDL